jgi:uncharacterized membrane protein
LDINENGQIVGWLWNDGKFPFLYSGGTLNVLGLPGTTIFDGEARAINNNGDVVGWGTVPDTTNAFIFGAFRYSGGEIQLLDANGVANDINDNGQIVGNFTNGFLYSNGVSSNPGTLPGALWYEGLSINEAGDIAGRAMFPNGSHAFAYIAGAMLDLGPGEATGINELGQVVGNFSGGFFGFRPFLFSSGALYDLEEVIGYPLNWAAAINDSGQITGEAGSGDTIAFLLTPVPEPSSVMLAAIGLVGLAAWGWRRRV